MLLARGVGDVQMLWSNPSWTVCHRGPCQRLSCLSVQTFGATCPSSFSHPSPANIYNFHGFWVCLGMVHPFESSHIFFRFDCRWNWKAVSPQRICK